MTMTMKKQGKSEIYKARLRSHKNRLLNLRDENTLHKLRDVLGP